MKRRSKMGIVLALFILVSTSTVYNIIMTNKKILTKMNEEKQLSMELKDLNNTGINLQEQITKLENNEYLLKYARNKLGVTKENEIIFKVTNDK